jgi:hypothetical protein
VAEYLVLKILRDSGTISEARFAAAIAGFEKRSRTVGSELETDHATGAVRARAVVLFAKLDAELAKLSDNRVDLYDVLRETGKEGNAEWTNERLRNAAIALTGGADIESLPARINPASEPDFDLTK